ASGVASYQWYYNGIPVGTSTDSFYVAFQTGTYAVMITDSIGCSSLSNSVYVNSVESITHEKDFYTFPDPAPAGKFTLHINEQIQNISVKIFNTLGELMYQSFVASPKASGEIINLHASKGI